MSKPQIEVHEEFLQARFNKEEWESFDEFKDFYLTYLRECRYAEILLKPIGGDPQVLQPIAHFPTLKTYQIWSEGTVNPDGTHLQAFYIGEEKGHNFADACHRYACRKYLNSGRKDAFEIGTFHYDPDEISYMGLKWYWSQEIASKSFG